MQQWRVLGAGCLPREKEKQAIDDKRYQLTFQIVSIPLSRELLGKSKKRRGKRKRERKKRRRKNKWPEAKNVIRIVGDEIVRK